MGQGRLYLARTILAMNTIGGTSVFEIGATSQMLQIAEQMLEKIHRRAITEHSTTEDAV